MAASREGVQAVACAFTTMELQESRAAIRRLLGLNPMSTVSWFRQRHRIREDDFEYVMEGARLTGLPEQQQLPWTRSLPRRA